MKSFRRKAGVATAIAVAAMAMVAATSAQAATPSGHRMYVNPVVSSAGSYDPSYGLFSCQVGLSVGQCYDPYQMRRAYGIDSLINAGYDGTGKTIVILDAFRDPNIASQLATFDSFYGLPAPNFTEVTPDGVPPYDPGWSEEISLDVQWAHAIAPGANIVLDLAMDNSDEALLSALNYAIDHNLGDVVSMSFGEADSCVGSTLTAGWHQAFVNATKKGITLFASSGDQGAAQPSCDGNSWIKSTSSPASDPLVTGVGGTELHAADYCLPSLGCDPLANPAFGTWLGEIGWNEGDPFGDFGDIFGTGTLASGGGYSTVWHEPAYQQGTIHGGKARAVPDVSYNGAVLHGVLTYLDLPGIPAGWYRFGGTSAGSPQWAGVTAIADQAAGHDYGFINSALYKIGQSAGSYAASFHDVTSGTNSAVEFDSSNNLVTINGYDAGTGWDAMTGLGSPKAPGLLADLAQVWAPGQATAAINDAKHG